ncbi:unnamed protein product [Phytophthora lilii]|uniref:Unnamed protein product n=1 Tax=Phytophthora lilii TaxID=2077276 RepID=A0A9W6WRF5_9STRA|nr:unnamed protein product [Phytophthora lilii]
MNETLATSASMACYTFAGLPFDVVKLRLQTQGHERVYKGALDALVRIAREEGRGALWKGGAPNLAADLAYTPVSLAASGAFTKVAMLLHLQKSEGDVITVATSVETTVLAMFASTVRPKKFAYFWKMKSYGCCYAVAGHCSS